MFRAAKGLFFTYYSAVVLVSISATYWFAFSRGQDFNWDQRNYHIGIPFLISHGAFWESVAPAGVQSYFNPLPLLAQYSIMARVDARMFVAIVAAVQSLGFVFAGVICRRLVCVGRDHVLSTHVQAFIGFLLCVLAPVALSESGTTFIDLPTGLLVIAAYAALLHRSSSLAMPALAGLLLGFATGLKLTNSPFVLGALAFALCGTEDWCHRTRWVLCFCMMAVVAFCVIAGPWHFELWERFRNPFFPYFNNVFHSPDMNFSPGRDERFLAKSFLDIWRFPLYWAFGGSPSSGIASPTAELPFIDVRWLFFVSASTVFVAALLALPKWRREILRNPSTGFFFAVLASYLIWLAQFAIQRYLSPIDILCGAALLFLATQTPAMSFRFVLLSLVAVSAVSFVMIPDWGHLPFDTYFRAISPRQDFGEQSTILFLTEKPTLYVSASLPLNWRYVCVSGDFAISPHPQNTFGAQLTQMISQTPKPVLKLLDRGSTPEVSRDILKSFGMAPTANCHSVQIAGEVYRLCDVQI